MKEPRTVKGELFGQEATLYVCEHSIPTVECPDCFDWTAVRYPTRWELFKAWIKEKL